MGRHHKTLGDYAKAIELYQSVYENESAKAEYRSQALFELGKIHSDLLNPRKDYQKAESYFEKLISEFPDSDLRKEAEKQLERIRELRVFDEHR
jgi:tetratricopeptide (TPR) repeat protein